MSWNVAGVRITRLVEFVLPATIDFFAEATPADVSDDFRADPWLVPD